MELRPDTMQAIAQAASRAGSPTDQLKAFVRAGYCPLPKAWAFHAAARECDLDDGPVDIGLGGARGPGKSFSALAQAALDDCQRRDGLKFLFLRNYKGVAEESFEDLLTQILPATKHSYSEGVLRFPNKSRIRLGGFKDERDIDKYVGLNYDGAVIEERNLISQNKLTLLYGSIRTGRSDWRPRKYSTFNPGGVGHADVKRLFVEPYRAGRQIDTRFFPGTYRDNPFLDKPYIKWLIDLKGPIGRAWREGDFDIFAGQALPDFDPERHVIQPIELPEGCARWVSIDYGFNHPFAAYWHARDPGTGRQYTYREVRARFQTDRNQARMIRDSTPPSEHISAYYASPDMWNRKNVGDVVTCAADEYQTQGLVLVKADNDRLNGVRKIHTALANLPDGKPGVLIFSTCVHLIECLPNLVSDPHQPEDMLKADADPVTGDGGDDEYDAWRYGFTNVRLSPTQAIPIKQQTNPAWEISFL